MGKKSLECRRRLCKQNIFSITCQVHSSVPSETYFWERCLCDQIPICTEQCLPIPGNLVLFYSLLGYCKSMHTVPNQVGPGGCRALFSSGLESWRPASELSRGHLSAQYFFPRVWFSKQLREFHVFHQFQPQESELWSYHLCIDPRVRQSLPLVCFAELGTCVPFMLIFVKQKSAAAEGTALRFQELRVRYWLS